MANSVPLTLMSLVDAVELIQRRQEMLKFAIGHEALSQASLDNPELMAEIKAIEDRVYPEESRDDG